MKGLRDGKPGLSRWVGLIGSLAICLTHFPLAHAQKLGPSATPFNLNLNQLAVSDCADYPYHDADTPGGVEQLRSDLDAGLQQGLSCLLGNSELGVLHEFHQAQANRLIRLLNSDRPKSLQCVKDELFAYAMAASPFQQISDESIKERLRASPELTILLDTYRIGGLLSKKFTPRTYEHFFKLSESQITQHLTGKPLRLKGMHRYENLPALLFHETVHWLGHLHSNIDPDLTFLYETCCFGGSEYIKDASLNRYFQATACNILRDDDIWSADKQQRIERWKEKGYDRLKRVVRASYD